MALAHARLTYLPKSSKKFLVIEDNQDDAVLITRAFRATESCRAFVCRNLSEAKAYLLGAGMYANRERYAFPNAVISDMHLGAESGIDLLQWLRGMRELEAMPVFILTGGISSDDELRAKALGAIEILRKPTKYEDLKAMLQDLAAKLCG
jgi:DNA-binding response OmpR family regulator